MIRRVRVRVRGSSVGTPSDLGATQCFAVPRRAVSSQRERLLFINNETVPSSDGSTLTVLSPRDGKPIGSIANATKSDVDSAVSAARDCFDHIIDTRAEGWGIMERAACLNKMANNLAARSKEFAEVESLDCGKPLVEARADMDACVDIMRFYASILPEVMKTEELPVPEEGITSRIVKEGCGVVACVTPWNYPLMQAVNKIAPAIAAGATTILKPSPMASLTCSMLGEVAVEADLRPGVLNIITGGPPGGDAGVYLGNHTGIDRLSFTGSGPTGTSLLQSAAPHLRPTTLELGGKGSMIVFQDVDIGVAVDWIMCGIFACTGQVCSATSRLLVQDTVKDKLMERLIHETRKIKVGDPMKEETQMGPLVSGSQRDKVVSMIRTAERNGYVAAIGGSAPPQVEDGLGGGYYVQPTVFTDVPTDAEVWTEEIFGPVLCVRSFSTEDEAVKMANDTPYGLGSAVMSQDQALCDRVSMRIRSGTVWQNCSQPLYPTTPFGGVKKSGFGRELGAAGIEEYMCHKTVTTAAPGHTWNWYVSS